MKADYTHICFVIDASGSMDCIANDVRGSFDSFMDTQRELPGEVFIDVYQFSGKVSHLVNSVALEDFDNDLMKKYTCQGCTALNDAVCTAIDELGVKLANMAESDRPSLVNFIIITDGEENASREFSSDDVKRRIKVQQEQYRWEFRFLAANQDAFAAGSRLRHIHVSARGIGQVNLFGQQSACHSAALRSDPQSAGVALLKFDIAGCGLDIDIILRDYIGENDAAACCFRRYGVAPHAGEYDLSAC